MYTHLHARRSGRSTRLVRAAIVAIHQGHAVYILCTNKPYMKQLVEQAYDDQVSVNLDWATDQLRR